MIGNFLDDFYDILFRPGRGLKRVGQEKNLWHGLLVYLVVNVIGTLSTTTYQVQLLEVQELSRFPLPLEMTESLIRVLPFMELLGKLTLGPLYFLASLALIHLSASLLGGENNPKGLGAVMGYSYLPYVFLAPVSLLARYLAFDLIQFASIIFFFWTVILKITGIGGLYQFPFSRALLAYVLPALALAVSLFLFTLLSFAFFSPLLGQMIAL